MTRTFRRRVLGSRLQGHAAVALVLALPCENPPDPSAIQVLNPPVAEVDLPDTELVCAHAYLVGRRAGQVVRRHVVVGAEER
eukprot:2890104-Heterocapsa_arctica.AAC.1